MAKFMSIYPPVSGGIITNPSVGINGITAPTSSTEVGGINPSGNLQPLQTNASGALITTPDPAGVQHVIVDSSALPTGASTSALQSTGNTSVASIDTKTPALVAGRVPVDGSGVTQPVSGTVSVANFPATQPVSGTVSVSNFPATQPVSGTVTVNQGTANVTPWTVDGSGVTQPISATTLPLPSGAATETSLSNVNSKLPVGLTVTSTRLLVDATGTVAVSNFPASQTVNQPGRARANAPVYNDYSSGNVTTGAYTQLVASTTSATGEIEIFDSSGQGMIIAVGAAASEVDQVYVFPGGNGRIPLLIAAGSRVSIKAKTATASSGYLMINFYA